MMCAVTLLQRIWMWRCGNQYHIFHPCGCREIITVCERVCTWYESSVQSQKKKQFQIKCFFYVVLLMLAFYQWEFTSSINQRRDAELSRGGHTASLCSPPTGVGNGYIFCCVRARSHLLFSDVAKKNLSPPQTKPNQKLKRTVIFPPEHMKKLNKLIKLGLWFWRLPSVISSCEHPQSPTVYLSVGDRIIILSAWDTQKISQKTGE